MIRLRERLTLSHTAQMLHSQDIDVEKPVHAVGQAALLALIQRSALDRPGHALPPAGICQGVGLYNYTKERVSSLTTSGGERQSVPQGMVVRGGGEREREVVHIRPWIRVRCCSLVMNWRSSALSLSLSLSRSVWSRETESIFGDLCGFAVFLWERNGCSKE